MLLLIKLVHLFDAFHLEAGLRKDVILRIVLLLLSFTILWIVARTKRRLVRYAYALVEVVARVLESVACSCILCPRCYAHNLAVVLHLLVQVHAKRRHLAVYIIYRAELF